MSTSHLAPGSTARLVADSVATLHPDSRQAIGMLTRGMLVDVVGVDPADDTRVIVIQGGVRVSIHADTLGPG